jgi:predicted DNA-binding ArsR family transcriptional regulator
MQPRELRQQVTQAIWRVGTQGGKPKDEYGDLFTEV